MNIDTFLDTGCTVFMWITLFLVATGITIAAFSYYGWRALWEIPKRIFLALIAWIAADLIKAVLLIPLALIFMAVFHVLEIA